MPPDKAVLNYSHDSTQTPNPNPLVSTLGEMLGFILNLSRAALTLVTIPFTTTHGTEVGYMTQRHRLFNPHGTTTTKSSFQGKVIRGGLP